MSKVIEESEADQARIDAEAADWLVRHEDVRAQRRRSEPRSRRGWRSDSRRVPHLCCDVSDMARSRRLEASRAPC